MAEAALEGYEREGTDLHPAWGLRGVALVAAHQGRLDEARRWAEEGFRYATDRGDVVVAVFHRHILGFVALSRGEWAEADAHLSAAAALAARVSVRHPGRFKLAGDQVEAALAVGDLARAGAIVATLEEAARIAPTPWVLAVGARSSALLAAGRGDLEAAAAGFDRAALEHARLSMPFELGRTLLAKGQLHRRRKEKRLADETLHGASAMLRATSARPSGRIVPATELARVGRRPQAPDELTETERRVAELAASGVEQSPDRGTGVRRPEDRRQRPRAGVPEARHPFPRGARGRPDRAGAACSTREREGESSVSDEPSGSARRH